MNKVNNSYNLGDTTMQKPRRKLCIVMEFTKKDSWQFIIDHPNLDIKTFKSIENKGLYFDKIVEEWKFQAPKEQVIVNDNLTTVEIPGWTSVVYFNQRPKLFSTKLPSALTHLIRDENQLKTPGSTNPCSVEDCILTLTIKGYVYGDVLNIDQIVFIKELGSTARSIWTMISTSKGTELAKYFYFNDDKRSDV